VCKVTSSESPPLCIFDFPSTDFSRSWEFGGERVEEGENRKGREEKRLSLYNPLPETSLAYEELYHGNIHPTCVASEFKEYGSVSWEI
jgi:hypothetical protein